MSTEPKLQTVTPNTDVLVPKPGTQETVPAPAGEPVDVPAHVAESLIARGLADKGAPKKS